MLYDPKWNMFSLESLISWLEKQPADGRYRYEDNTACLLSQYFTSFGYKDVVVGGTVFFEIDKGVLLPLPYNLNCIALGYPNTFGAALERARASQEEK